MCSPSRLLLARTALSSAPFIVQISRVIARSRYSPVQTRTVVLTSKARAELSMVDLRWIRMWGRGAPLRRTGAQTRRTLAAGRPAVARHFQFRFSGRLTDLRALRPSFD